VELANHLYNTGVLLTSAAWCSDGGYSDRKQCRYTCLLFCGSGSKHSALYEWKLRMDKEIAALDHSEWQLENNEFFIRL